MYLHIYNTPINTFTYLQHAHKRIYIFTTRPQMYLHIYNAPTNVFTYLQQLDRRLLGFIQIKETTVGYCSIFSIRGNNS